MSTNQQQTVHRALAKRIVEILADQKPHISKQKSQNVLCPILKHYIAPATVNQFGFPNKWSTQDTTTDVMTDELLLYFDAINFFEPT